MEAQIVIPNYEGIHNAGDRAKELLKEGLYKDVSTVIICPTRGTVSAKVVQSWMSLIRPMNQKIVGPIFGIGMEVGESYNLMIKSILDNPFLRDFKYIVTIEEDNTPPPDALLKLYESIQHYDVVGSIYWTKGEGGQPMIYGNPKVLPKNFIPQVPIEDGLQECNGMGMGFHIFKMDIFKKMPYPWFKTVNEYDPSKGVKMYTQDLYFFEEAAKYGFRFACDTRVKTGHYDINNDIIW